VKVGHRQAFIPHRPVFLTEYGAFAFVAFGLSGFRSINAFCFLPLMLI
jgi:hypothetical protein